MLKTKIRDDPFSFLLRDGNWEDKGSRLDQSINKGGGGWRREGAFMLQTQ